MLTVAVLCYFVCVLVGLALVFLPRTRGVVVATVQRCGVSARTTLAAARGRPRSIRRPSMRSLQIAMARRAWWIATISVTLALPPLLAWLLQPGRALDTYDHTAARPMNEDVAALLRGEQLVPPTALPPALFATPEVEAVRPLSVDGNRRWDLLDDEFRQRLLTVYRLMQERHGYEMVLLEGYRSPERQARLAALGSHVTGAVAGQSYHQYGLAADSAFRRDGKVVIAETDAWAMRGYALFGELARSAGLVWGGGWRLKDFGHLELRRAGTLGRSLAGDPAASPVCAPRTPPRQEARCNPT